MTPPNPDLHTFYDDELGERLYWAAEQLAFDGGGRLLVIPERFLSDGFSIPKMWRGFLLKPRVKLWQLLPTIGFTKSSQTT